MIQDFGLWGVELFFRNNDHFDFLLRKDGLSIKTTELYVVKSLDGKGEASPVELINCCHMT